MLGETTNDTTNSDGTNVIYNNQSLTPYNPTGPDGVTIPKWCNYIIAIVIGGGGWVNVYRDTNDQHFTSGSGGGGGIIAWKSPELIHKTDAPLKYDINIEFGRQKQVGTDNFDYEPGEYPGKGGNVWITIYKTEEGEEDIGLGSCQATGGQQAKWVTGGNDDNHNADSLTAVDGGQWSFLEGTRLYSSYGYKGEPGVVNWQDGTNNAYNGLAGQVDSWATAGQGAYWGPGDTPGPLSGADSDDSYKNGLQADRIEGGSNGACRVYFIANIN